jgi:predicted nucleotide-binding protein (sugar kinase/HSP70/actin superfamily)
MAAYGVNAIVLPEPDERNLLYGNMVTSGKECLPYRVTLGDFLRFFHENGHGENVEGFMPSSFGPCRLGKYALEQSKILREMGCNLPIRTTVSNNAYADMGLSSAFERLAWRGLVAGDCLERLLWHTRPYERVPGSSEELFQEYLSKVAERTRRKEPLDDLLKEATAGFKSLIDPDKPRRPLVGINGEIFLRSNKFSNSDLVKACEGAGLEVVVSPMGEWIKYITHRNIEDAIADRKLKKIINGYLRKMVQGHIEHKVASNFKDLIEDEEPTVKELLSLSGRYLSSRCGSEAVLSIGSGIEWMESPKFAGVISVMPHGCMPGGVVAAISEKLTAGYGKPWISLTYDGFAENTNLIKINNFAEIIKFCAAKHA